jgi:tRNA pseudouridine32 synthase/23S rRNA pseudouridine746 synthase
MLQGVDVAPNPLEDNRHLVLPIVFEDEDICVVCKPSGMLSVPGKSARESVYSLMKSHCKDAEGPLIVHRLDMATSGLMVIAKNWTAYHCLQGQFLRHEVKKRYVARLSRTVNTEKGVLTLPLRPDLDDRPRQMVDPVYGKEATTFYQKIDERHVALYPQTGRTHQLRVHCAHPDGLDNPIEGDELYGQRGRRLCLHAEQLTFCHPRTGERMTFEWKADFDKEP